MTEIEQTATDPQPETAQAPRSYWFAELGIMDGMRQRAGAQLAETQQSLVGKDPLPDDVLFPILRDLNAWNVAVFIDCDARIPAVYYELLYAAAKALAYRAIEWAQKQEG